MAQIAWVAHRLGGCGGMALVCSGCGRPVVLSGDGGLVCGGADGCGLPGAGVPARWLEPCGGGSVACRETWRMVRAATERQAALRRVLDRHEEVHRRSGQGTCAACSHQRRRVVAYPCDRLVILRRGLEDVRDAEVEALLRALGRP